jgi:hypothetical protein
MRDECCVIDINRTTRTMRCGKWKCRHRQDPLFFMLSPSETFSGVLRVISVLLFSFILCSALCMYLLSFAIREDSMLYIIQWYTIYGVICSVGCIICSACIWCVPHDVFFWACTYGTCRCVECWK